MSHAQTQATLHRQGPAWTMYGAYVPRCSKAASRRWLKLDPAGWILTQGWKSAGKPTANHEQFESAHVMPSGAGATVEAENHFQDDGVSGRRLPPAPGRLTAP